MVLKFPGIILITIRETWSLLTKNFKKRLLKKEGYTDIMKVRLSINMEGKHNERYWSDEFPKAIEWLFFSTKDE